MKEQRRHQRVRFGVPPQVRLGQSGVAGTGQLENLSLGGLVVRTDMPLKVGEVFGCEFSVFGSVVIDVSPVVMGHVGNMYSARFQVGPINESIIEHVLAHALSSGKASVLTVNESQGRRVMRVTGGLNGCLRNDFMHGLNKVGVDEIDLSGVTDVDPAGAELCRVATEVHRVGIVSPSFHVKEKMAAIAGRSVA